MTSGRMLLTTGLAAIGAILAMNGTAQAHPSTCSSCHVPHMAAKAGDSSGASYGVPLWNPAWGSNTAAGHNTTFTLYTSPTFDPLNTGITQPDGPSKLCLGCHDGSGNHKASHLFGDTQAMTLTESHPLSFVYDSGLANNSKLHVPGALKDPSVALSGVTPSGTIAKDLLDSNGKMQCTSCHDIHSSNPRNTTKDTPIGTWGGSTLRFNYTADNGKSMCRTCHNK